MQITPMVVVANAEVAHQMVAEELTSQPTPRATHRRMRKTSFSITIRRHQLWRSYVAASSLTSKLARASFSTKRTWMMGLNPSHAGCSVTKLISRYARSCDRRVCIRAFPAKGTYL